MNEYTEHEVGDIPSVTVNSTLDTGDFSTWVAGNALLVGAILITILLMFSKKKK